MSEITAEDIDKATEIWAKRLRSGDECFGTQPEKEFDLISSIAAAIAEARGVKPGHVRTDDGVERLVLGTFSITKDGCVVAHDATVYHPKRERESFNASETHADFNHRGQWDPDMIPIKDCYSTREAAQSAK